MIIEEIYTTEEKKTLDLEKPKEEQTEQNKTILSNDAFAVSEMIERLIQKIEHARISLNK